MEGEQKPIIIVDESRLDFIFHIVGLAAELGACVGNLDRLAVFIRSFKGDFAGLGLPLPDVRKLEESGDFPVPGVADRIDLPKRIETISLGDLFENWRARLRPEVAASDQSGERTRRIVEPGSTLSWSSLLR